MRSFNLQPKSIGNIGLKSSVLVLLFPFLFFDFVQAATLYLMPQSQTVYQGDTFIVEARLDTEREDINAVKSDLIFSPDLLEVIDLSKGGSMLSLWAKEPVFSNEDSFISFTGGLPGGFIGEGLILKTTFLAKEVGKTNISFKEDSQVLLNDGMGTQAALMVLEGSYEILERPENLPSISSNTHSDQNKWHNQNALHLHWALIEGAQYSYLLSQDPLAEPDEIPDRPEGELKWIGDMEFPNLEDGIYYFTLKQKLLDENWSKRIVFRVMVDVAPPEPFDLKIGQDPSVFEGKYFLSFATTDKTSGIDYYEIKEGERDFKKVSIPYLLEDQTLQSKITVKAVDKAGNEQIAEIIPPKKPIPYSYLIIIFILIIVGAIAILFIIRRIGFSKPRWKIK